MHRTRETCVMHGVRSVLGKNHWNVRDNVIDVSYTRALLNIFVADKIFVRCVAPREWDCDCGSVDCGVAIPYAGARVYKKSAWERRIDIEKRPRARQHPDSCAPDAQWRANTPYRVLVTRWSKSKCDIDWLNILRCLSRWIRDKNVSILITL